jgi:copper chaperone CopZ
MKIIKSLFACALVLASFASAKAQFTKADVQVSGLTCSMCQLATQKSLKTLDFVSDIKPDLNKNVYVLTFKKGKTVDLDLIKKKVKDAGFSVSKLVASFDFDNVKISDNFHYKYGGNVYHFMNVAPKTLDGPVRITVLDKDFIPAGEFKKYAASTKYACYNTRKMGSDKIYHVTL